MQREKQLEKEIQRLKSAVEELTVLNDLALAAGSIMEESQMFDVIVQKSVRAVHAAQGSILLVTEQQDNPLQTLIRRNDSNAQRQAYRVGAHITGWVLKNKQALIVENLAEDKRFNTSEADRQGIHTLLCVPIWHRANIIGILMVTNKRADEVFTSGDMRLLTIIAAQSGQLIRNSQLQGEAFEKKRLEHELDMAHDMQLSLLPDEDPEIPGLDIASYFNPTDAVGGDYYDYFPMENGLGVVIADVCGHGASAALMMTMIQGIVHSLSKDLTGPEKALSKINKIVNAIVPEEIFITMQFLIFDLKNNLLSFSNAGHNPLIYFDGKTSAISEIELKGTAINLMPDGVFNTRELSLKSGDMFLIYTDGITEATNEKLEMYTTERLKTAVVEKADESAVQVIRFIRSQFDEFTANTKIADDVAMIAVKIE